MWKLTERIWGLLVNKKYKFHLLQGRLNWSWFRSALSLIFDEFFENAANKDPGKVEDNGSGKGVEDWGDGGGAEVLLVSLLDEQDQGLEVTRAESGEVDDHPRN